MRLWCRHPQRMACRVDDELQLRCSSCGKVERHPWSGEPRRYHLRYAGGAVLASPKAPTGIEREAKREEQLQADVDAALQSLERKARAEKVVRMFIR